MKLLFENWRKYMNETNVYKRVVLNELTEIAEEQLKEFPLSEEELEKIKSWGELEGDPLFLGSGTMGSAYQFGDLVLKITKDYAEAMAAKAIEGKFHPNVYKVRKVAKRDPRDMERAEKLSKNAYLIVYDLVGHEIGGPDLPNMEQQNIIKSIHANPRGIFYNWPSNFDEIKNIFSEWVSANPEIVEQDQIAKFKSHEEKLGLLLEQAGLSKEELEALKRGWGVAIGFYSQENINSSEGILNALQDPRFDYVNEVSKGLTFLEEYGVHFKDLKTTNVMNDDGNLVIIDIGKSYVRDKGEIPTIGELAGANNREI